MYYTYLATYIYIYTKNVAKQTWKISRRKGTLLAKIIEKRQKFGEVEKRPGKSFCSLRRSFWKLSEKCGKCFLVTSGKRVTKGEGYIKKRGEEGVCVVRKYTHTHCTEKGSGEKPNGKRMIFWRERKLLCGCVGFGGYLVNINTQ